MRLDHWQKRWGIPDEAVKDLKQLFISMDSENIQSPLWGDETSVSARVRLEASQKGLRLWRNNVGATYTQDGSFFRYGLANESKKQNEKIKSADLIGIRPIKITTSLVGLTIGQFVSREIKHSEWKYMATDREQAQLAWAALITSFGGDACFATNEGTL